MPFSDAEGRVFQAHYIGEFAAGLGRTSHTIRRWERQGVLPRRPTSSACVAARYGGSSRRIGSRASSPQGQCTPASTVVRGSGVVRAAAQAAVVVAQDERLRLLAGSALGRRTDQSKQSAAGVDDPRRRDQSL